MFGQQKAPLLSTQSCFSEVKVEEMLNLPNVRQRSESFKLQRSQMKEKSVTNGP